MSTLRESSPAVPAGSVTPRPPAPPRSRGDLARGLLRTARPKQWVKNVLVFAAPGAAGVLDEIRPLAEASLAFVIFCLAAAGTYFLNDAFDVEADRRHPTKRNRPIAAGTIPLPLAWTVAAVLLASAIGLAFVLGWRFALVIGLYVALQLLYSSWMKHEPVLDLAGVAAGFVLRAIGGGLAVGVPLSNWFLIVASFGSLFMITGKRHAEHVEMGGGAGGTRRALAHYSLAYLGFVRAVAAGVALTAYCLWAFERSDLTNTIWDQLSIVPFTLAILRYALLLEQGKGGAPEELVLGDRTLQLMGLCWAVLFAVGIYAG